MNPLHQIPTEISNMIKDYARTEYEPFFILTEPNGQDERETFVFHSIIEDEYIEVIEYSFRDLEDFFRLQNNNFEATQHVSIKPLMRILRKDFLKTVKYLVRRLNGDNGDIILKSSIFELWIEKDGENDDDDNILRQALEFAEEYFEVAIKIIKQ